MIIWSLVVNCYLNLIIKFMKCLVWVINVMYYGKFYKLCGNVILMVYDEKVIMVILFLFWKNGFVIFWLI